MTKNGRMGRRTEREDVHRMLKGTPSLWMVVATYTMLAASLPVYANTLSGKYICIINAAAGVDGLKAGHVDLPEDHRRFVLDVDRAFERDAITKELCAQSTRYWSQVLTEKGSLPPGPHPNYVPGPPDASPADRMVDDLSHTSEVCYATTHATVQFFDSDRKWDYYAYDIVPDSFRSAVSSKWIEMNALGFEMGDHYGGATVVYSGKCQPL